MEAVGAGRPSPRHMNALDSTGGYSFIKSASRRPAPWWPSQGPVAPGQPRSPGAVPAQGEPGGRRRQNCQQARPLRRRHTGIRIGRRGGERLRDRRPPPSPPREPLPPRGGRAGAPRGRRLEEIRRGAPDRPIQASRGRPPPPPAPPSAPGPRLGAPDVRGQSALGRPRARSGASSRPGARGLPGLVLAPGPASGPWSSSGCSPPSPAPRASLRTCWCACCSSHAAGWGREARPEPSGGRDPGASVAPRWRRPTVRAQGTPAPAARPRGPIPPSAAGQALHRPLLTPQGECGRRTPGKARRERDVRSALA